MAQSCTARRTVLMVKNCSREGPGLLEPLLKELGIAYAIVNLDAGEPFPDPRGYAALVVLGGPDSANDDTSRMRDELMRVRQALDEGIPFLGICLGLQVLVKAAGGSVVSSKVREVGWRDPQGTPYTISFVGPTHADPDPLLAGLPKIVPIFQLHGETVVLPDAQDKAAEEDDGGPGASLHLPGSHQSPAYPMTLLATGAHCENQLVRVGKDAYGIQGHLELTPEMLAVWAEQDPDLIPLGRDKLLAGHAAQQAAYEANGRRLLENFLRVAKLC